MDTLDLCFDVRQYRTANIAALQACKPHTVLRSKLNINKKDIESEPQLKA